jgi:hypothetical protein
MPVQRGRRSSAALSISPIGTPPKLKPPAGLTAEQLAIWKRVIGALPTDYFGVDQTDLLRAYVTQASDVALMSRQLAEVTAIDPVTAPADVWKRARQLRSDLRAAQGRMGDLAVKLRITNQSRLDAEGAARKVRNGGGASRPWEAAPSLGSEAKPWEFGKA